MSPFGVGLYWLPLGAGGHSVRFNGKAFEAVAAWHEGRPALDLYHSGARGGVGEMWNSSSVVAWLLDGRGSPRTPSAHRRADAPAWHAGVVVA